MRRCIYHTRHTFKPRLIRWNINQLRRPDLDGTEFQIRSHADDNPFSPLSFVIISFLLFSFVSMYFSVSLSPLLLSHYFLIFSYLIPFFCPYISRFPCHCSSFVFLLFSLSFRISFLNCFLIRS